MFTQASDGKIRVLTKSILIIQYNTVLNCIIPYLVRKKFQCLKTSISSPVAASKLKGCCTVDKLTHSQPPKTVAEDGLKKRTAQLLVYCIVNIRLMKTVEGKICWEVEDDSEDFFVFNYHH